MKCGIHKMIFAALMAIVSTIVFATNAEAEWRKRVEVSGMTDETNVFLSVESDNLIACGIYRSHRPILVVRCMEDTTALIISTSCFVSDIQGYGNVLYRLDKDRAVTKKFRASTNNEALGLWRGSRSIPVIKSMLGHKTMLVRFTPFNESPKEVAFNVTGLDSEIGDLREACNW